MGRRGDHSYSELSRMVIDAAYELLEKDGYNKVSTRKISAHIGYTVGTLYNLFANIDEIFININGKTLDKLYSYLNKSLDQSRPKDGVKSLANAYIQFSNDNFNIWSMLFEYRFPKDQVFPKWYADKISALYFLVGKAVSNIAPRMNEVTQKTTIMVLWSGIHGICSLSIKGKLDRAGVDSAHELVDNFIDNYLKGLGLIK